MFQTTLFLLAWYSLTTTLFQAVQSDVFPVSYTHLDVYKRQPFTGTCVVRRKPPSVAPANTITLENKIMYPI